MCTKIISFKVLLISMCFFVLLLHESFCKSITMNSGIQINYHPQQFISNFSGCHANCKIPIEFTSTSSCALSKIECLPSFNLLESVSNSFWHISLNSLVSNYKTSHDLSQPTMINKFGSLCEF